MSNVVELLYESFFHFFVQYFATRNPNDERMEAPFQGFLCDVLQNLKKGARLVLNQPPRTGKSLLINALICWHIGRRPTEKILIISNNTALAEEHVYEARKIMQSAWFKKTFPKCRIAKDRSGVQHLQTTLGGGFYARSMRQSLGGIGANVIIIDDGNRIDDAAEPQNLEKDNQKFDGEILSRLNPEGNKKRRGIVLNVQHRLAENDLSAHLVAQGFDHLAFPLEAPRTKTYRRGDKSWTRNSGHLLMENYSQKELKQARQLRNPPYFYFYQQGVGRDAGIQLKLTDFRLRDRRTNEGPFVISIDAAQGDAGSFNVAQVWDVAAPSFHLRKQFCEQCGPVEFERAVAKLIKRFRPGAILVENAANGPALVAHLTERLPKANFIMINPQGSKTERLARHCKAIAAGAISLQQTELWIDDYISEFLRHPKSGSDQVDATTQLLDWRPQDRRIVPAESFYAGPAGFLYSTMQPIRTDGRIFPSATPGIARAQNRPFFRKY